MKMKIKASELYIYQQEAEKMMKDIDEKYNLLLSPIYKDANIFRVAWVKFKSIFSWPPSLRFYHFGERLTKDEDVLHKAEIYREL